MAAVLTIHKNESVMSILHNRLQRHLDLVSENDLHYLCNETLDSSEIGYFEYLRVYDDGHSIIFSSNHSLIHYIFTNEVPILAPVDPKHVKACFSYFIIPTGKYEKAVHDIKENFNLAHFINLVECHQGYMDIYCFGAHGNNPAIVNFYLNHMDQLENFKRCFMEKFNQSLKKAHLNRIILQPKMLPTFKSTAPSARAVRNPYALSKRQIECLKHLISGMTMREIANALDLSPRTVEHYIDSIKSKMNCYSRVDIFAKAAKIGIRIG